MGKITADSTTATMAEPIPTPVDAIPQTSGSPSTMSIFPSLSQSTPPAGANASVAAAIASRSAAPPPPDVIPNTFGGSSAKIASTVSEKLGPGYGIAPVSPG